MRLIRIKISNYISLLSPSSIISNKKFYYLFFPVRIDKKNEEFVEKIEIGRVCMCGVLSRKQLRIDFISIQIFFLEYLFLVMFFNFYFFIIRYAQQAGKTQFWIQAKMFNFYFCSLRLKISERWRKIKSMCLDSDSMTSKRLKNRETT